METAQPQETSFTYEEAATRIGINPSTFRSQAAHKVITTIKVGKNRRVPESEVAKWEKYFSTINTEFSWLPCNATNRVMREPTVTATKVARLFGVHKDTVGRWTTAGLLPYYPNSLSPGEPAHKNYRADYIEGVLRYANGVPVRKDVVQKYMKICKAKERIV